MGRSRFQLCFLRVGVALAAVLVGLATLEVRANDLGGDDPLERVNRSSHRIGLAFDRAVFGPVARAYMRVVPGFVRIGVTNFIDNLTYPNVILNDFLQGKVEQGLEDSMRFVVNTTFGLAGFIDFATTIGLERHDEDLGQTLAVWGVEEIAYLDLPGAGPSSVRDVGDFPIRWQMSLLVLSDFAGIALPIAVLGAVNARANANAMIEFRDRIAVDTYVFTRESYRRRRNYLSLDGEVPEEDDDLALARERKQEHLLSLLHGPAMAEVGGRTFEPFYR